MKKKLMAIILVICTLCLAGGCKALTVDIWDGIDGDTRVYAFSEVGDYYPKYVIVNRDGTCIFDYGDPDYTKNWEDASVGETQYDAQVLRNSWYDGTYGVKGTKLYLDIDKNLRLKISVKGEDAEAYKSAYLAAYPHQDGVFDENGCFSDEYSDGFGVKYVIDIGSTDNKVLRTENAWRGGVSVNTVKYEYNKDGNPSKMTFTCNYFDGKTVRKYEYTDGKLSRWTKAYDGTIVEEKLYEYNADGSVTCTDYGGEGNDIDVNQVKDCVKLQKLLSECIEEWREETGASKYALISEEELLARYTAKTGETEFPCCPHPDENGYYSAELVHTSRYGGVVVYCGRQHYGSEDVIEADNVEEHFALMGIKYKN